MNPVGPFGTLETLDGFRYQLTADDVLWLGRAVQFEGADETDYTATLWAFAQRFAGITQRGTFEDFIRSYSQPVNPIWDELTDAKCIQRPDYCTPAMMRNRALAATIAWDDLRPAVKRIVLDFTRAKVANRTPRATDFASYNSDSWFARQPASRLVLRHGRSWYVTVEESNAWPKDYVFVRFGSRIANASGAGGSKVWPWILGATGVAVGGWLLYRWTR